MSLLTSKICVLLLIATYSVAVTTGQDSSVDGSETAAADSRGFFPPKTSVIIPGLGKIQGTTQRTYLTQRQYPAFTGIPYGKIVKRFAPSEPFGQLPLDSNGVFDATKKAAPCIQPPLSIVPGTENGGVEDCLTLDIYSPKVDTNTPLPVIFFIHGGSFYRWSGNMWNGQRLLERDVVVVSINYRLGMLGFLCLGNDDAPGNAGLYDMTLALQWVQKYISYFGGDPKKVTIAGQSAGAASVSWLLDSPLSKGLVSGAIAISGADVDGWAIQPNPIANGLGALHSLSCLRYLKDASGNDTTTVDTTSSVSCLNSLPASSFMYSVGFFYSAPAIQSFPLSISKIAPLGPQGSMESGVQYPVPLIIGTTKHDATFILSRTYSSALAPLVNNSAFLKTQLLPLLYTSFLLKDDPPGYFASLTSTYVGDEAANSGNWTAMLPGIIDLFSAFYFKMGAKTVANYHSTVTPNTFVYSFDYFGDDTYYPYTGGVPQIPRGVTHVDDLMYVFNLLDFTKIQDYVVSNFMVDSWANFATTGDPNLRYVGQTPIYRPWPRWNPINEPFIKINTIPTKSENYTAYWIGASTKIQG